MKYGNSSLNDCVEEYFNIGELVAANCDVCKNLVQVERKSKLKSISETEFIIIVLGRGIYTLDGYELVEHRTFPTNDVFIR